MKRTLSLMILVLAFQTALTQPAFAQVEAVEAVAKVSSLVKLKNALGFDKRFVMAMVVAMPATWVMGEMVMPHAIKGLCALEKKTSGRQTLMPKKESCNLYYGDPMVNSCQVSNNAVALMFPNPNDPKTSIRFVGAFDQGKLVSVRQSIVIVGKDPKKPFTTVGFPVEVFYDAKGMVFEYKPDPKTMILAEAASEDDKLALDYYNEVGAVMRSANNECKEGMYDKTMQQIIGQKVGKH